MLNDSNKPKVTIAITNYNQGKWLQKSIESSLSQTWDNKEVIVSDDGSTDNSLEILKKYQGKIAVFPLKDFGANASRNFLLENAKGDYIQFLDADDYLNQTKIELQFQENRTNSPDVLFSPVTYEHWDDNGQGNSYTIPFTKEEDIYTYFFKWQVAHTATMLWKKKSLKLIGGWNEKQPCCQDNELMLRAIFNNLVISFCPTSRAFYRVWSQNTLSTKSPKHLVQNKIKLIKSLFYYLREESKLKDKHRKNAGKTIFECVRTLAKHDLSLANKYYFQNKKHNLIYPASPSAPLIYRIILKIFGFKRAEKIAKSFR